MCARTSTARAWPCLALSFLALTASPSNGSAQTGGTCVRIEERAGRDLGCFITAREELGSISKDSVWFWHLETFPSRTRAENEKGLRGTVVESFGEIWLFTIADSAWKSKTGTRVARIGPIPLVDAARYAAVYMEGVFAPGMASEVHRHPGAEAWYTLAGEMCLEWATGTATRRARDVGPIIPGRAPMLLTGAGAETRRSLVLILQDATQPRSSPAQDWTPRGLCTG